jgi:hypothetical protein
LVHIDFDYSDEMAEINEIESEDDNRNHGLQPIAELMSQLQMKPHDLVAASTEQLTHKMVSRAMKGRRLTSNTKGIVQRAFNQATGSNYNLSQLFNY